MTLGEKLQTLRNRAGLSQEDLADRLGVSRQAISKWELDKTVPDVKYIVELSELFEVSTDYLLKEHTVPESETAVPDTSAGDNVAPKIFSAGPRDCSPLINALLLCGNGFLFMLLLLSFPMRYMFSYRLSFIPPLLVLLLAPVFLLLSRAFLRPPAKALRGYCHLSAACLTLWGFALAMLLGYHEVIDDLLFSMVEGAASIPLLLLTTAVMLGPIYAAAYFITRITTRSLAANE